MIRAWVIGSGGLLGSALCRALRSTGTELFFPSERFCWGNEHKLTLSAYRSCCRHSLAQAQHC